MNLKVFPIIAMVIFLASCAPVATPMSTVTRIPTQTPYPTSTLANTATPIATYTPVVISAIDSSLDSALGATIPYWTEQITKDPQNANAYYQRAYAIVQSNRAIGSKEAYVSKINLALKDVDTAIALRPDLGEYYSLRQSIYDILMGTTEFIVDSQYLAGLALENAEKAYELGTTDEFPDRTIINELIASNQCDKALDQVQKLIEQTTDITLGGLLHIRSRAYACLGRLEDALQSVNDSMFNNENMAYKNDLKAQYLILLERYEEALPLLNEQICHCELAGWHHYLRAEIYFNTGKKDLVQDELFTGMMKTWGRGGMLTYVEAQLALEEGRTEDAIQLLQFAEATFSDPIYNALRWKVQEQLKTLGAEPLTPTLSVEYPATPIP